jgi:hypothetical protein
MTKNSSTWIKKLKNKKNRKENLENPITKIKRKKIKYATQQVWGVFILSPRFKKPPKKKSRKRRSKILTIEILQLMELNSNFSWKSKLLCSLFYFSNF